MKLWPLILMLISTVALAQGNKPTNDDDGFGGAGGGALRWQKGARTPSSTAKSEDNSSDDLINILDGELDEIETINVSNTSYNEIIEETEQFAKKCKGDNQKGGIYSQSYSVNGDKACLKLVCAKSIEAYENKENIEAKICFNNDVYKKVKSLKLAKNKCDSKEYKGHKVVWDKEKSCAKVHCKLNLTKEAGKEIITKLEENKLKTPLVLKYCKADSDDEENERSTASNNKPHVNKMSPYMQKPRPTMLLKGKDSHKGRWNTSDQ